MKESWYQQQKEQVQKAEGMTFPAQSFTNLVLKPAYDHAKIELLEPMMEVNRAHLLMLNEQKLLNDADAKTIAQALETLDLDQFRFGEYTGKYEDLFFEVEDALLQKAGDIAGNLHLARSRNDMCVSMYRMVIRKRLLRVMDALQAMIDHFLALAQEHKETMTVLHTHTQQAQISTVGHYLLGACQLLQRDMKRLKQAFATVNRSSMGACAITTTGFDISRERMVELLAFDDLALNSYDAIGGADYLGETATAMMLSAIDAGKIVQDLLLWATQEFDVLRAADPYVQVSSIMPQKRNPVSIEHLRSMLSNVVGSCQTMLIMLHNTPYGDIVDTEDDAQPCLWHACDVLYDCYSLWGNVMMTVSINKEVLRDRAYSGYAGITELADTLVRETSIPFRTAHHVASDIAKTNLAQGKSLQDVDEEQIKEAFERNTQKVWQTDFSVIKKALDPENFINIRNIKGGCGPKAMNEMIETVFETQQLQEKWIKEKVEKISEAEEKLSQKISTITE